MVRLVGSRLKKYAKQLFSKIGSLAIPDEDSRKEIYRNTILAFERLQLRDRLSIIEKLPDTTDLSALQYLFEGVDELEAAYYHQIVKARLEVIRSFSNKVDSEKERVIQKYLFDHLWLLDPSWERATIDARLEESAKKAFGGANAGLTKEEMKGRIDIRLTLSAGKHVIIELKKYDVSVGLFRILEQMRKYRSALEKLLMLRYPGTLPNIETVAILGEMPADVTDGEREQHLRSAGARIVTYDDLIKNATANYQAYLDADERTSRLVSILERL